MGLKPRPEIIYPAKLTKQEQSDIATQVEHLQPAVAQQMLDVIESKIQSGQIRTNPASVLRGILRKYQTDPDAFDPSSGFQIADQRRCRAEAESRISAAAAPKRNRGSAPLPKPIYRVKPRRESGVADPMNNGETPRNL